MTGVLGVCAATLPGRVPGRWRSLSGADSSRVACIRAGLRRRAPCQTRQGPVKGRRREGPALVRATSISAAGAGAGAIPAPGCAEPGNGAQVGGQAVVTPSEVAVAAEALKRISRPYTRNVFLDLALWRIHAREFLASCLGDELRRRVAVSLSLLLLCRLGHFLPLSVLPWGASPAPVAAAAAAAAAAGAVSSSSSLSPLHSPSPSPVLLSGTAAATASALGLAASSASASLSFDSDSSSSSLDMGPLTLFNLGISPYLGASLLMQLLLGSKLFPALTALREEGPQGMDTIEQITTGLCLLIGLLQGFLVSAFHLRMSSGGGQGLPVGVAVVQAVWLALGALLQQGACTIISKNGLGDGTSLLVCMDILSGLVDSLGPTAVVFVAVLGQHLDALTHSLAFPLNPSSARHMLHSAMFLVHRNQRALGLSLAVFGAFLGLTAATALLVGATRKIHLNYFDFDTSIPSTPNPRPSQAGKGPTERHEEAEEEEEEVARIAPHVPFPILPSGMYPVFSASLLATSLAAAIQIFCPSLQAYFFAALAESTWLARIFPTLRYAANGVTIVVLNSLAMEDTLKDIADNMVIMGARIPRVRPGTATLSYLREARDSARLVGGVLLAALTLSASLLDRAFLSATSIRFGLPSLLIIVGTVIALRRSVEAHQQVPRLLKVLRTKFKSGPLRSS